MVGYICDPGGPEPSHCGYCKSPNTNFTEGVWALRMTCEDFQDLVDRGFQRSGRYVYRAVNDRVCCPQYVIRMDATRFRPSKSQRKVVKRFHRYLQEGRGKQCAKREGTDVNTKGASEEPDMNTDVSPKKSRLSSPDSERDSRPAKKQPQPGTGADPARPKCRKAKDVRRERRLLKTATAARSKDARPSLGQSGTPDLLDEPVGTSAGSSKEEGATDQQQDWLDLLTLPDPKDCVHKLEIKLIRSWPRSPELVTTFPQSYALFKKFQTVVHSDDQHCNEKHFTDFVVESPLVPEPGTSKPGTGEAMPCGYGSYHQQYWLDGNLVAVGLLDILPRMIVCEYFYYDPSYKFLSLGVYSAIREIAFVRELGLYDPRMRHYCMGFYVHSCPKMAYKNQYDSAELLCPITLRYVPIEKCIPKLEETKYCQLAEGEGPGEQEETLDLDNLAVFHGMSCMTYGAYRALYGDHNREMLKDYGRVVGGKVGKRMKVNLNF